MARMAVATISLLMPEAPNLVLNQPLTVYTPHDLGEMSNSKERLL
jgi:hypothetical protein